MVLALIGNLNAQETAVDSTKTSDSSAALSKTYKEKQIEKLVALKEKVKEEEREYLKKDIEVINKRLDNKEITAQQAEDLKKEAAQKRAANIEDKLAILDKKIALYERAKLPHEAEMPKSEDDMTVLRIGSSDNTNGFIFIGKKGNDKPKKYDRRTTSDIVFAIGFNNTLIDGQSLDDSPYKIGGSGFVELGYAWKTRIFKDTNFWRFKYGFSLQWNKLNIKDNNYLVNTDGSIDLQEFPLELNKAKFRTTNLVFPMHLEFGPSKKIEKEDHIRYSTRKKFKLGIGGYAGLNIGSMQKLKYRENGERVKDKQRSGLEVNDFVYGLSSYIAFGDTALYVKYDLNPLFKNQTINQNNISVGVRFDMD